MQFKLKFNKTFLINELVKCSSRIDVRVLFKERKSQGRENQSGILFEKGYRSVRTKSVLMNSFFFLN